MPTLSIIIPVYNSEKYLKQCLDSILAQASDDFEILLIDDGSTDFSGKLCDEYASRYNNIYVFHEKNRGVSAARNKGIERAQGEYVIFVDSDDWLEKNALSFLMAQESDVDLIFYGSSFHSVNENVTLYSPNLCICHGFSEVQEGMIDLITNPKYYDYLGFTWNKVFRSNILKEYNIRFIENLSYREDEVFTLHYAHYCKKLMILPNIVYNYRVSDTGLTKKKHTYDEFLLLSHAYQKSLIYYTDKRLQEYMILQIIRNYLNAIKRISNIRKRNTIIKELWVFYQEKNIFDMSLKIKSVYRHLLCLPSAWFMNIYMSIKLLFK